MKWEATNGSLDVYSKLFPSYSDEECIRLWRDGKYTNVKVWVKKVGIWWDVVHVWAHPTAAGAVLAPEFDQDEFYRIPSRRAA